MPRAAMISALVLLLPHSAAADESVLLLRNGVLLTGKAENVSGRIRIVNGGSEVWLETAQVAGAFTTPSQAHDWLRQQTKQPGVADHLRLANWAMQNKLFAVASRELLDARQLSPGDPRIASAERQLRELAFPRKGKSAKASTPKRPRSAMSDAKINELPPGVLEQFMRQVQPLLVNNCTTGCHLTKGPQTFQLDRALLHGRGDRESTRANLAAVLAAIDRKAPSESPLLVAALSSHAGRKGPAFTGRHANLGDRLVAWVDLVTRPPEKPAKNSLGKSRSPASAAIQRFREQQELDELLGIGEPTPAKSPKGFRDEFDPEIFNRMAD